jgi:acetyltransferase-like isoleucine patch superfamily enzyme
MAGAKTLLSSSFAAWLRATESVRRNLRRISAHAHLSAALQYPVPSSVVVLGKAQVYGTGQIQLGEHLLLYPQLYLETLDHGQIEIGDGVVISTGTHLVSMASISIGAGSMIGEYCSIRDANHLREPGKPMRDSRHRAAPIVIGKEVWIGRGVAVLQGVTIGDGATIGANAVVTRDVAAGAVVAGVPAKPIIR